MSNSKHMLREKYKQHFRHINTTAQLRATLRAGPYAWPGGYPLYFVADDGGALCFDCVRAEYRSVSHSIRNKENDGWRVVACCVNWEDNYMDCAHCGERIEPAYLSDR